MTDNQDKLNGLHQKLEDILKRQDEFSREVNSLRIEINELKIPQQKTITQKEEIENILTADTKKTSHNSETHQQQTKKEQPKNTAPKANKSPKNKMDIEKFIGENLINKIGIALTVIGVAIGAKYSIEHDLISPLTRIVVGYLTGIALLGVGIKLKKKYKSYSAVLVSGAMAIMYFITYAAFSFYGLMPQVFAFLLMLVFTTFTVVAAINYNKQVIAQIGLVGAYAVPFLLSENSGNITILFSYMAIINIGILFISIKKYWKPLYYSSFVLSWLMYFTWYISNYSTSEHFALALTFLSLFFILFYVTFLAYKLLKKELFKTDDILLLLANSFIFYGIGYAILNNHQTGEQLLGLFTLGNAVVHFIVSIIIFKQKNADKNMFYLVMGLAVVFITIAVPVQLNGNWVTLLWAGEAALLFWIGRTKQNSTYEKLSYVLMFLAFFSIAHHWIAGYHPYNPEQAATKIMPLLNINFLSSLLFIAAFGFINLLNRNANYPSAFVSQKSFSKILSFSMSAILIGTIYFALRMEIANYWNQLYAEHLFFLNSKAHEHPDRAWNNDLNLFKIIWIINYSLLFVSALSFANYKKIRNRQLGLINLGLITLALGVFLIQGLYVLSELRENYLNQSLSLYYQTGAFNIGIRYISIALVALALAICNASIRANFAQRNFKIVYDLVMHISVIWIASSELINCLHLADSAQTYKLGLSILWGIYALALIVLGIWKNKRHLRIGAISLFALTLLKLFVYDISHLNTISKFIVSVSLGILLLIISFLYTKYKHIITAENDN